MDNGGGVGGLVAKSCLTLVIPETVACQTSLSMGFPRQEYWSGLLFPPPGNLPNPDIEPMSPVSPVLAGGFFITEPPGEPRCLRSSFYNAWHLQLVNRSY